MHQGSALSRKALKIFTSNASRTVLDGLAPAFERASGRRYVVEFDSAKSMLARIESGETGDIVILSAAVVHKLETHGTVRPGSRRLFARSRVGVAVRAGAAKPDISTVDAFKRALLDAKSVAHTVHGASGMSKGEQLIEFRPFMFRLRCATLNTNGVSRSFASTC